MIERAQQVRSGIKTIFYPQQDFVEGSAFAFRLSGFFFSVCRRSQRGGFGEVREEPDHNFQNKKQLL